MERTKYWDSALNEWVEISPTVEEFETHKADYLKHTGYAVATGSANAYIATLNPALSAYAEGVSLRIKINIANTGASTVNVNGLGTKPIKKADGFDIASGDLKVGSIYTLAYNGSSFILQGEGGGKKFKTGTFTVSGANVAVTGIGFSPRVVMIKLNTANYYLSNSDYNVNFFGIYNGAPTGVSGISGITKQSDGFTALFNSGFFPNGVWTYEAIE